jgi:hypothetical protein
MNLPPTNIDDVIVEIEKNFTYYASLEPNLFVEILDTDEYIATIHTYHLNTNQSWVFNYSWATGVGLSSSPGSSRSWGFYWGMYIPPDTLSDSPLIVLGSYQARKVEYYDESGRDEVRILNNYYHKDLGVMIFNVHAFLLINKTYHIYTIALVSANVVFPRIYTGEVVVEGDRFVVETVSNSTISGFSYSVDGISFNVSGDPGSLGFCNVSVPKALVKPGYTIKVYFDDNPVNYSLSENSTHYFVYFTYKHSTHRVNIRFEQVVPTVGTTCVTTTVYERVVDWSTAIPIAVILLVVGIAIGYLIKRK